MRARRCEAGADVTIVSSDKDLMQLVRPGIRMYDTMKNKVIGEAEVMERFGVPPAKVIEVQALIGDSTDNVPGVPGIGVKTAALLIDEYGDLETLLARASEITQPKRRESLITFADQARLSRTLVTLDTPRAARRAARRDGGAPAGRRDADELHAQARIQHAAPARGGRPGRRGCPKARAPRARKAAQARVRGLRPSAAQVAGGRPRHGPSRRSAKGSPAQLAEERAAKLAALPFDRSKYETVTHPARLAALLDAARDQGHVAFRAKLTSSDPMQGELVGVALALRPGHAAYVPLGHRASDGLDLGGEGEIEQMKLREALDLLKPLLEDPAVLKIVQNAKFDMVVLSRYGIALTGIDDPCLMSYALDAGRAEHLPEQLAGAPARPIPASPRRRSWARAAPRSASTACPVARATEFAGEEADIGLRLWLVLKPRLVGRACRPPSTRPWSGRSRRCWR